MIARSNQIYGKVEFLGPALSKQLITGTIGELLVQIRLLQFDVQAAAPLKDSGNDLIAVRGRAMRTMQVKTTAGDRFSIRGLRKKFYHIIAAVRVVGDENDLHLDKSEVFLIPREELAKAPRQFSRLSAYRLTPSLIERLFEPRELER